MQITYGDKKHHHNSNILLLLLVLFYIITEMEKDLVLVIP